MCNGLEVYCNKRIVLQLRWLDGWSVCHNTLQCIVTSRDKLLSFFNCNTHSVLWLGKDLRQECIAIHCTVL